MTLKDSTRYIISAYIRKGRYSSIGGGSSDIYPLVQISFDTYDRVLDSINPKETQLIWGIKEIVEATQFCAMNTFPGEVIKGEDFEVVKALFDELYILLNDVLMNSRPIMRWFEDGAVREENFDSALIIWEKKISFISDILFKNQKIARIIYENTQNIERKNMIFGDYKALYEVIHKVNNDWNSIVSRGISSDSFDAYRGTVLCGWSAGVYPTEKSKLDEWMSILDGVKTIAPAEVIYYKNLAHIIEETIY